MTRLHPDDIRAIAERVVLLLGGNVPQPDLAPMSIGQQAIALARQGRIEESKALLKSHGKRRSSHGTAGTVQGMQ